MTTRAKLSRVTDVEHTHTPARSNSHNKVKPLKAGFTIRDSPRVINHDSHIKTSLIYLHNTGRYKSRTRSPCLLSQRTFPGSSRHPLPRTLPHPFCYQPAERNSEGQQERVVLQRCMSSSGASSVCLFQQQHFVGTDSNQQVHSHRLTLVLL